jgi:hypothetical protein
MGRRKHGSIGRQVRGKVRRFFLAHTRRGRAYIQKMERHRRGECERCGACCRLLHRCLFLRFEDGLAVCAIHTRRPANCRIFPADTGDLADRNQIAPDRPCGFSFVKDDPS